MESYKNKLLLLIIILFFSNIVYAKLHVYFDCVRFLDDDGNTRIEITYRINNNELCFKNRGRFTACINVNLEVYGEQLDKLRSKNFSKMIVANSERDTYNADRFFIDKMSITVSKGTYRIVITVTDEIDQNSIVWDKEISVLNSDNLIEMSDIEINSFVSEDTTEAMKNFRRNDTVYLVNPSHIYNIDKFSKLFYYYEFYSQYARKVNEYVYLTDKNGEVVFSKIEKIDNLLGKNVRESNIDIANLEPGKYFFKIKLTTNKQEIRKGENVFVRRGEEIKSFSYNVDEEFRYLKYFIGRNDEKFWNELNITGKQRFIRKFWEKNDPNPITNINEFRERVITRFEYADEHFSYYGTGWDTDRGRIYIKNGAPEEVIEEVMKFETKPYKIWKYYSGYRRVYIFVDFSGDGNYRLVYSENDDRETNDPSWRDYLGSNFNMDDLK
ncbi:MAG: hypothetical protein DRH57_04315 [Candidatus Cloacimonadota bacterium]|nr:MAG: hypothetical protein DRH57_04315 [Candidatus Cloacimonadota bacterium]